MGSHVSPVVANRCVKMIEESTINNSSQWNPTLSKRYVDDSFCSNRKDVWAFRNILNSIDRNISFIIELDCDGKISFLNTLVSRRNGAIAIDVYRKPTDWYLDFNPHQNSKHVATTAATLLQGALNLLNSSEGKKNWELSRARAALESNGYPSKFIQSIQTNETRFVTNVSSEEVVGLFFMPFSPLTG